jgi:hypothetical protein
MTGPVEHDGAIATIARRSNRYDIEPPVAQVHRGATREAAYSRRVQYLDANAHASGRLGVHGLANRLRGPGRRLAECDKSDGDHPDQKRQGGDATDQATSFHRATVSG